MSLTLRPSGFVFWNAVRLELIYFVQDHPMIFPKINRGNIRAKFFIAKKKLFGLPTNLSERHLAERHMAGLFYAERPFFYFFF